MKTRYCFCFFVFYRWFPEQLYHEFNDLYHCPFVCSPEVYVDLLSALPPDLEKPDCARVLELPYSIHAFQHLRVSILVSLSSVALTRISSFLNECTVLWNKSIFAHCMSWLLQSNWFVSWKFVLFRRPSLFGEFLKAKVTKNKNPPFAEPLIQKYKYKYVYNYNTYYYN